MDETQCFGVKGLSFKGFDSLYALSVGRKFAPSAIGGITNKGMSYMGQMHPYLMRASSFEIAINLRCVAPKCFNHTEPCDRVTTTMKQNGLFLTVSFVPSELGCDFDEVSGLKTDAFYAPEARITLIRHTETDGAVCAFDSVCRELVGEAMMCGVRFRDDQQARGVFIYAMHDAGAFFATDARQIASEMVEKRVDQCAGRRAKGRVNDHTRGFVNNEEVFVLVHDVERYRFGERFDLGGFGDSYLEHVALTDFGSWISDDLIVLADRALRYEASDA